MSNELILEENNYTAIITLNNPQKQNSLDPIFNEQILNAFKYLKKKKNLRTVILKANGKNFSTGGDLKIFYQNYNQIESYCKEVVGSLNKIILEMIRFPIPIITQVQGLTAGGSIGFILASDLVYASPDSFFQAFYPQIGFSPDGGWATLMPEIIGQKRCSACLLNNEKITAKQALNWGLINQIIEKDIIFEKVLELASHMNSLKMKALKNAKKLLRRDFKKIKESLELELNNFVRLAKTKEAYKGLESLVAAKK